jgi:hypothetical protein
MLGLSKPLNTSNSKIYSKKVKDVTMNNEQVALHSQYVCEVGHLRDYTGIGTFLLFSYGCLRYSPLFCEGVKLVEEKLSTISIFVCKPLKIKLELSINRLLAYYSTSTKVTEHFEHKGEDKLDPN